MQVKTFEAVDMKQALELVKQELGPHAVIVSSRSVRRDGGMFGLLGRKVLEVTAAVEERKTHEPPAAIKGTSAPDLPPAPGGGRSRGTAKYHDIWMYGHVGLYCSHSSDGRWLYLLGGNQSNRVCIKPYPAYRFLEGRRIL